MIEAVNETALESLLVPLNPEISGNKGMEAPFT